MQTEKTFGGWWKRWWENLRVTSVFGAKVRRPSKHKGRGKRSPTGYAAAEKARKRMATASRRKNRGK